MIRTQLRSLVQAAVNSLVDSGRLPAASYPVAEITDTKQPEHGDYACNFALTASKLAGMNPRQVGELLREALLAGSSGVFSDVEVAGPGFVNLRLEPAWIAALVPQVLSRGISLPNNQQPTTNNLKINVEFVSVNPNGPITIGSGRGAAYGSTLCNLLVAAGHEVHREYYINDGTNSEQMRQFAESVKTRVLYETDFSPLAGDDADDALKYLKLFFQAVPGDRPAEFLSPQNWRHEFSDFVSSQVPTMAPSFENFEKAVSDPDVGRRLRSLFSWCCDPKTGQMLSTPDELIAQIPYKGDYVTQIAGQLKSIKPQLPVLDVSEEIGDLMIGPALVQTIMTGAFEERATRVDFVPDGRGVVSIVSGALNLVDPAEIAVEQLRSVYVTFLNAAKLPYAEAERSLKPFDLLYVDGVHKVKVTVNRSALQATGGFELELDHSYDGDVYQIKSQELMLEAQGKDLESFGVKFDTWFSEQSLHDSGIVAQCVDHLIANGSADEEAIRHKLKLAKGGKVEDVIVEGQCDDGEGDDGRDIVMDVARDGGDGGDGGEQTDSPTPRLPDSLTPRLPDSPASPTLWLRSTKFGDDMDRVLRRKDGRLTYIASDVAYHKDKFNRPANADKLITILGPDHHGYIGRLHAVLAAQLLGEGLRVEGSESDSNSSDLSHSPNPQPSTLNPSLLTLPESKLYSSPAERDACQAALAEARQKLEVQIFQLVRFLKDGKPAPMRKRDGNIYALIDLIDEIGKKVKPNESQEEQRKVGKDVARFFYLMRSHETTFDFDLDLAERQSDENPVFYVQYAHARICSVLRKAETLTPNPSPSEGRGGLASPNNQQPTTNNLLSHPKELELIKKIADLPYEVQRCAEDYGVHRLTTYAIELARTFHHFYDACRVIQEDQPELTQARLQLCEAARLGLKATFDLLGIEAPDRMDRVAVEE